jgi:hypothetical protein
VFTKLPVKSVSTLTCDVHQFINASPSIKARITATLIIACNTVAEPLSALSPSPSLAITARVYVIGITIMIITFDINVIIVVYITITFFIPIIRLLTL